VTSDPHRGLFRHALGPQMSVRISPRTSPAP
jgi:hypothetical protein